LPGLGCFAQLAEETGHPVNFGVRNYRTEGADYNEVPLPFNLGAPIRPVVALGQCKTCHYWRKTAVRGNWPLGKPNPVHDRCRSRARRSFSAEATRLSRVCRTQEPHFWSQAQPFTLSAPLRPLF
jgi:hypothetical protein